MKKLILVVLTISIVSCGTFNPGSIDRRSAVTTPGSKIIDSVYIYIKQYEPQEAKLIFDVDFRYYDFEPIYISIFNKSSSKIIVYPDSIWNYVTNESVNDKTAKKGFVYFLVWSTPWALNLIFGLPFYYGIIWPIIGVIAGAKTSGANSRRAEFYNNNSLEETELLTGQETNGIVFLMKSKDEPINVNLYSAEGKRISFSFENNSKMFFR